MPRKVIETAKLEYPLSFRLTESEYLKFKEAVAVSGQSPSVYFRNYVLGHKTFVPSETLSQRQRQILYWINSAAKQLEELLFFVRNLSDNTIYDRDLLVTVYEYLQDIQQALKDGCNHARSD